MHYGQRAFSSNGKETITPKETVSQSAESTKNKWNILTNIYNISKLRLTKALNVKELGRDVDLVMEM